MTSGGYRSRRSGSYVGSGHWLRSRVGCPSLAWTDGKVGIVANSAAVQVRRVYDESEDGNGSRVLQHRHPQRTRAHPMLDQRASVYPTVPYALQVIQAMNGEGCARPRGVITSCSGGGGEVLVRVVESVWGPMAPRRGWDRLPVDSRRQ